MADDAQKNGNIHVNLHIACIDTIIFDLGAVLTDHLAPKQVVRSYGIPYGDAQQAVWRKYKTGKCTEKEFWDAMVEGTGYESQKEKIMLEVRNLFVTARPAQGYRFVPLLKDRGYRIAILSNHSIEWGRGAVKCLDLERFCDPVIISGEIGMAKPHPEIYAYALAAVDRSNAPEKCIFIDDKQSNVDAAKAAGMNAVRFVDGNTLEHDLREFKVL